MIKSLKAAFAICLATIGSYAFEGTYDIKGYDPYEKMPYEGTLTIKKDKNGVYQASWDFIENGTHYQDTGTGLKSDDDKISFIFEGVEGSEELGLQLYKVKNSNTLEGPFVLLSRNLVGKETITKRENKTP
jgi:hypothetical protein